MAQAAVVPGLAVPIAQLPRLGRYELLERIGRGGMAEVYKARLAGAHGVEKVVALKRMLPGADLDPRIVELFVREARISARLMHPNLIQVFEFGQEQGQLFLAMELVDGCDLRHVLDAQTALGKRMPPELAVCVARSVLHGLEHAHRLADENGQPLNVVHRDLSPSNVLLSYTGAIKVSDFGVAHVDGPERTDVDILKGKLRYMAPEQLASKPVDCRVDVFAAGCLLFEMLAGVPVYTGDVTPGLMRKVARGEVPRVAQAIPGIDSSLAEVVQRALEPNRDRRTPTCERFAAELLELAYARKVRLAHESELALYLQVLIAREPSQPQPQPQPSPAVAAPPPLRHRGLSGIFDGMGTLPPPPPPLDRDPIASTAREPSIIDGIPLQAVESRPPLALRRRPRPALLALLATALVLVAWRWPDVKGVLPTARATPTPSEPVAEVQGEPVPGSMPSAMRLTLPALLLAAPSLDPTPAPATTAAPSSPVAAEAPATPAPHKHKKKKIRQSATWE